MSNPYGQHLGAPFACFECRKSFKRPQEPGVFERPCPSCGGTAYRLMHKFKPPKSADIKQWEKVKFLYDHGFWFQSLGEYSTPVSIDPETYQCPRYPTTLDEARVFVEEFKDYAITREDVIRCEGQDDAES